jgi:hypothetical protein
MRITKAMLEEENGELRYRNSTLMERVRMSEDELRMLKGIITTYSRMTSLVIATEKISDALAHTVSDMKRRTP